MTLSVSCRSNLCCRIIIYKYYLTLPSTISTLSTSSTSKWKVKRKLERSQYKTAKECAEDIRLIWLNCKTYNADGSDFYLLAEGFSKKFEDRYKKIQAECKSHSQPLGCCPGMVFI